MHVMHCVVQRDTLLVNQTELSVIDFQCQYQANSLKCGYDRLCLVEGERDLRILIQGFPS